MDKYVLESYAVICKEIADLEERIEDIRASLTSPRTTMPSLTPRRKGFFDAIGAKTANLMSLETLYKKKHNKLFNLRLKIESSIELLEPIERLIIRYRYFDRLAWDAICVKIGYEWAQAHRVHRRALQKLESFKTAEQ